MKGDISSCLTLPYRLCAYLGLSHESMSVTQWASNHLDTKSTMTSSSLLISSTVLLTTQAVMLCFHPSLLYYSHIVYVRHWLMYFQYMRTFRVCQQKVVWWQLNFKGWNIPSIHIYLRNDNWLWIDYFSGMEITKIVAVGNFPFKHPPPWLGDKENFTHF